MKKRVPVLVFFVTVAVTAALTFFRGGEVSTGDETQASPGPSPALIDRILAVSPSPLSLPTPGTPTEPFIPRQEVKEGFIRYIPNRDGDIDWKLEGSSVRFVTPGCLEISDLTATSLDPGIGDLTIAAVRMLLYTDSKNARSDEERVTVRRENMVLTGKGFLWTPDEKQIRVFEDVKLLIKESGNQGLFPL